ncbi:MAG: phenylacetate--CoA ligase family protein [Clostridia bacterium]|nr:phenylacetate--CoA ligase family protein [Clostridia bacterium]
MTTVQGYIYKKERYGKAYKDALNEFNGRDYSDLNSLQNYQWERFSELLRFAVNNSPFYKDFYKDIDIEKVINSKDITLLPVLEKETVRQNIDKMYAIPLSDAVVSNTSGTTGKSMKFYYLGEDLERRMAYLDAFKQKHGFIAGKMKRASFNSSKIVPPNSKNNIFWRDNLSIKQRIYSGYHCKSDNCKYYVDNLNIYKPDSLDGYPSAMYELAKYIIDNNVSLTFTPVAIFPTAETLLPHYREVIEKAFNCPVRDQYASSEGAPFITECKCGKLHYCMDTGIIEFSEDGRMLVTCFETHGTPLIRYDIGDRAFLSEEKDCECGCGMPIVDRIEGRSLDYILSPENGKFTSIYMSLVSSEFSNCMKAMQFVQNELTAVDVYLETDENYDVSMNKIIEDKLHYSLGEKMEIRIHTVDEIEKEPSGKFRLIKNNII